jgi:hypothetical protein
VGDQGFNFSSPPRREAKKPFEPPPWEQDQFKELARRREGETPLGERAEGGSGPEGQQPEADSSATEGRTLAQEPQREPVPEVRRPSSEEEDLRIEQMLLVLKNEEPPFGTQIWKYAMAAAAVLAAVGVLMLIWGVVAIVGASRSGAMGWLGGGILVAFGFGFVGVGGWIAFRTLRQQGVL